VTATAAAATTDGSIGARSRRRNVIVVVLASAWIGVALWSTVVNGIAIDRERVLLWLCSALVGVSLLTHRPVLHVVRDWLPLALLLVVYDYSRGAADAAGMTVHVREVADLDRSLFGGTLPTAWLQEHLEQRGAVAGWESLVTLVYVSHFFVPFAVAAWWWCTDRTRWAAWVRRFVGLTAVGLTIYVLYPAAPPWLASEMGVVDGVERTGSRGWSVLHLDVAQSMVHKGQASVNVVAAMPSLHAGYAALLAVFCWRSGRALRALTALYALAMGFVLVLSGEHYVVDVLAAWCIVAAVSTVAYRWERRAFGSLPRTRSSRTAGCASACRRRR
jgi:hypothetical protein